MFTKSMTPATSFKLYLYGVLLFGLSFSALTVSHRPAQAQNCEYWVAPNGNNAHPGTSSQPWATMTHAAEVVPDNHCTVWFKSGTYDGGDDVERRFNTLTTFKAVEAYTAVFERDSTALEVSGARNIIFDGFVFRHDGPGASGYVVIGSQKDELWLENITFRNNIFHDSYKNDLLKIHNRSRFITIENNIFFNQGDSEQHMDINSVTDITIQDNILFNDFAGSGRSPNHFKAFIVIKDSNDGANGLFGSKRVTVRRNIFMNWESDPNEVAIKVGNDGKPYHEAEDVQIENNLFIGNSNNEINTVLGVRGSKDVTFANNTIVGDLPANAYAMRVEITGDNPQNENIAFYNNIWSDPTGTMGAGISGGSGDFSDGDPADTINSQIDNNLYWNGGEAIPSGDFLSPMVDDAHHHVANPLINSNQNGLILPRWNGSAFPSGKSSIRQEFERLVQTYGRIPAHSPAIDQANLAFAPTVDILGNSRGPTADLGAYEFDGSAPPPPPTDFQTYLPIVIRNN